MAPYASIEDVRDEGLPDDTAGGPNDTLVQKWLVEASSIVDKVTGIFFGEHEGTFIFDGTNSHYLHLHVPIIEVTEMKVNGSASALDPSLYRVYDGKGPVQDDRRNPKIELRSAGAISSLASSSLFTAASAARFRKGWDQTITGKFGWVEPDGSVPVLVRRMTVAIVMTMAQQLYTKYEGVRGFGLGPVVREKTDGHELQFGNLVRDVGTYILPTDIENKLILFRRPFKVRVPTVRWTDIGWHRIDDDSSVVSVLEEV